jgi:hypothetical protein
MSSAAKSILLARLKEAAAKQAALALAKQTEAATPPTTQMTPVSAGVQTAISKEAGTSHVMLNKVDIGVSSLDDTQRLAFTMASRGESFVLIGAAGYGKTTTTKVIMMELAARGLIGKFPTETEVTMGSLNMRDYDSELEFHKTLKPEGLRVAVVSFTNVATANIRNILPEDVAKHCVTCHKLVEYRPVEKQVPILDAKGNETGGWRTIKPYEPRYGFEPDTDGGRGCGDKRILPDLDMIVFEEAATIPVWLYKTVLAALGNPTRVQQIFLGDLQQLTPVFGDGILGYKMLELPVVELKTAYRNVGCITRFAHRIISGKPLPQKEIDAQWNISDDSGSIEFRPFKRKIVDPEEVTIAIGSQFRRMIAEGRYDPYTTQVLIPYNKGFGTIEMNKWMAQGFTDKDWLKVYHVIAGKDAKFLCVGDKIRYEKVFYRISSIVPNHEYVGRPTRPASRYMDRWGRVRTDLPDHVKEMELLDGIDLGRLADSAVDRTLESIEELLAQDVSEAAEARRKASHLIELVPWSNSTDTSGLENDLGEEATTVVLESVGDVMNAELAYSMTVHKAQGSEWENVYYLLHRSHAALLSRELLYTGCTRARRNLTIIYDSDRTVPYLKSVFHQGIVNQDIPGDTVEQKLEYFRRKLIPNYSADKAALLKNKLAAIKKGTTL